MFTDARPPARHTRTWQWGDDALRYDLWSTTGRPVLFLHSLLFDRTMWWPAAAELQETARPIAVDLPGHGASPARDHYDPGVLVGQLASLIRAQHACSAPIIVGHGASAGLASLYARRFTTRAVVLVDPYVPTRRQQAADVAVQANDMLALLTTMTPEAVPFYLREYARPQGSPALLAAYHECLRIDPWNAVRAATLLPAASNSERILIYGQVPTSSAQRMPLDGDHHWRCRVYRRTGGFPQLSDVDRFCTEITALL